MKEIFISDLPVSSEFTSGFADAFDEFMPIWLEQLLPYYDEAKNQGCDIFEFANFKPMGAPCELYEKNGIGYYKFMWSGYSCLGFNSDYKYQPVSWHECFYKAYPSFSDTMTKCDNTMYYSHYMWRVFNRKSPYDIIAKRVEEYFKKLTNDPDAIFSLSATSFICFSEAAKNLVDSYRAFE